MALIGAILPPSQVGRALWILAAALATLAAAWTFQAFGFSPCELCLAERYAFYAAAPVAALAAFLASRSAHGVARVLFALLALVFLANVGARLLSRRRRAALVAGPDAPAPARSAARRRQRPDEVAERRARGELRRGAVAHPRTFARRLGRGRERGAGALRGARPRAQALSALSARLGLAGRPRPLRRAGRGQAARGTRRASRGSRRSRRPIGTPMSTSVASASCRLASIVSGTASVTPRS